VKLVQKMPVAELFANDSADGVSEVVVANCAPFTIVEHFKTSH